MSVLNVNTIQPVGSASTVTLSGILAVSGSTSQTSTFTGNGVQVDHSSGSSIFLGSESGTDAKFSVINNAPLQIRTNNIEKVRIGAGGSVGIGISDADITLLHLAGITSPAQGDDYATLSLGSPTQTLRKVEIGARRSTVGGDWDNIGIGFKVHESNSHTADPVLKMVLDYDGNLGVGTFNPALKLHIQDGIVATPTTPNSNCDVVIEGTTSTGIQFLSDTQTQLRFGSSGSTGDGSIIFTHSDNQLRLNTTGFHSFDVSAGRAISIESDNKVYITEGNTYLGRDRDSNYNGGEKGYYVYAGSSTDYTYMLARNSADGSPTWLGRIDNVTRSEIEANGDFLSKTNSYTQTSDQRLKENIVDANSQWDDVKAMRIRNYNFTAAAGGNGTREIGLIAQELEASGMVGLVTTRTPRYDDNGNLETEGTTGISDPKAVRMSIVHVKALKALQEAMTKIESLETANSALTARVTALESS